MLVVLVNGRAATTRGEVEEEKRRRRAAIGSFLRCIYHEVFSGEAGGKYGVRKRAVIRSEKRKVLRI